MYVFYLKPLFKRIGGNSGKYFIDSRLWIVVQPNQLLQAAKAGFREVRIPLRAVGIHKIVADHTVVHAHQTFLHQKYLLYLLRLFICRVYMPHAR